MAQFSDFLKEYGVEQEVIPLESPWRNGRCERAGGLWKDVWNKVCIDVQVTTMADALTATSIVTQTRNAFPRPNGYSPNQWVLGHPEARLPGSLLNSDESQQLEVLEAAENPESAMAKNLSIREAARVAQIRLDTDSRVRRALLRQSTPTRGPFPVGSYVYFYRRQPQRHSTGRTYNWYGPARVIGVELRNPRRTEDGDPGTDGSAPHSYWLRYGPSVVLASGEQLRFASEDELLAAHYVPHYAVERGSERGARNYVDVRHQLLLPQSLPQQQLTGGGVVKHDFWQTHPDGRIIRVHNVPRRSLYTPEADGCPVPVEELQDQRVTEVIYEAEMRDHVLTDTIADNWRQDRGRELVADWVGDTTSECRLRNHHLVDDPWCLSLQPLLRPNNHKLHSLVPMLGQGGVFMTVRSLPLSLNHHQHPLVVCSQKMDLDLMGLDLMPKGLDLMPRGLDLI